MHLLKVTKLPLEEVKSHQNKLDQLNPLLLAKMMAQAKLMKTQTSKQNLTLQIWMLMTKLLPLRAVLLLQYHLKSLQEKLNKVVKKRVMTSHLSQNKIYNKKTRLMMMTILMINNNKIEASLKKTMTMMKKQNNLNKNQEMCLQTKMVRKKLLNVTSAEVYQMKLTKMRIQTATRKKRSI